MEDARSVRRLICCLTVLPVIAACASASMTGGQSHCALTARDSVYLAGGPVYRDCAVERRATPVDRARPELDLTDPPLGGKACYIVELEFVVDTAGVPEEGTTTVVRTNNPDLASAIVAVVPRWRYRPATINGKPVRQIVHDKESITEVVVAVPVGQTPRPPLVPTC